MIKKGTLADGTTWEYKPGDAYRPPIEAPGEPHIGLCVSTTAQWLRIGTGWYILHYNLRCTEVAEFAAICDTKAEAVDLLTEEESLWPGSG